MKKGLGGVVSTLAGMAVGAAAGGIAAGTASSKKIKELMDGHAKVHELYMAFDQWLRIRQEGKTLVDFFEKNDYKTVAIYGMKELGERLYFANGSDKNIKITTKDDFELSKAYLKMDKADWLK